MIIVKLFGGLGNQLFQYACGLSQARKLNTELRLNTEILENTPMGWTKYDYELGCFEGVIEKIDNETKFGIYKEGSTNFSDDSMLEGYFQNESFFENVKDELREKLAFKDDNELEKNFLKKINYGFQTISIHARRGDYLVGNHFVDLSETNYYKNALDEIFNKLKNKDSIIENPKIIIFSNDIEWAKKYFEWINLPMTTRFEKNSTIEDLYLMSRCYNNITANSTFSWWASWLNKHNDKIVIQPKQWYVNNKDYNDLYFKDSLIL